MEKLHDFAERHPLVIRAAALMALMLAVDAYAEVHAWTKGIEQISVSESIGG